MEKRRAAALEKSAADTETTQLIDRYKFIDLFPCSADELQGCNSIDILQGREKWLVNLVKKDPGKARQNR